MGAKGIGRVLSKAMELADAVMAESERLSAETVVVAVDRGGRELLTYRADRAHYTAIEPARRKAVTSAAMGMPTSTVAGFVGGDPLASQALSASPDMLAVPGGFPIIMDNVCVGGIGVAGGHYAEDHRILAKIFAKHGEPVPAMPMPPPGPAGQGGPPGPGPGNGGPGPEFDPDHPVGMPQ